MAETLFRAAERRQAGTSSPDCSVIRVLIRVLRVLKIAIRVLIIGLRVLIIGLRVLIIVIRVLIVAPAGGDLVA
jgi:hypothetical protein